LLLKLKFTVTDADGDTSTSNFGVKIVDDPNNAPVAIDDGNPNFAFGVLSGNYYAVDSENNGLQGNTYNNNNGYLIDNLTEFKHIVDSSEPVATFDATKIWYGYGNGSVSTGNSLEAFLNHDGDSLEYANGHVNSAEGGVHISGSVFIKAGTYNFKVYADDGYDILIDGDSVAKYENNQSPATRVHDSFTIDADGWYDIDMYWWDQGGEHVFQPEISADGGLTYTQLTNEGTFVTPEDTPITFEPVELLANDFDVDGDSITIVGVDNATNGTATLNPDGSVTFVPEDNFSGKATFTYTISDGELEDSATVTVYVNPVADTPSLLMSVALNSVEYGDNLIVNGSFEDLCNKDRHGDPKLGELRGESIAYKESIPGWDLTDKSGDMPKMEPHAKGHADFGATDGNHYMDLGASPGNTAIYQDIPDLVGGKTYKLEVDYKDKAAKQERGQSGRDSGIMQILWNGVVIATIDGDNIDNWETFSVEVTAQDGTNRLTFSEVGESNDNWGMAIDNVRLSEATFQYDLHVNAATTDPSETLGDFVIDGDSLPENSKLFYNGQELIANGDGDFVISDLVDGQEHTVVLETGSRLDVDDINAIQGSITSIESDGSFAFADEIALNEIVGTSGDDTIDGTDGSDLIISNGGSDTIDGGLGDDTLVVQGDSIDLSNVSNIETIKLDTPDTEIELTVQDVLDISSDGTLEITGDGSVKITTDSVEDNPVWTKDVDASTPEQSVYTAVYGSDSATLIIDQTVTIDPDIV
jgi:hypothetical protein